MDEIYSDEYKNGGKGEVIEEGLYKGYKFVIKSLGPHPCAYVGSKKPLLSRDELDKIGVHGGVTYNSDEYFSLYGLDPSLNWFGWDYAHAWDYHPRLCPEGTKYTIEEILADIKEAIDQYEELEND